MEVPLLIWEVPLLIWLEVPLLIWEVPLLIWWVGGKMNSRIRLTSAKVGVEVEAELGNKAISSSNLKLKMSLAINSLIKGAISNPTPMGNRVNLYPNHHKGRCQVSKYFFG